MLVTLLDESMPFKNFWLRDDLLLLERTNPDVAGGRFMLLSFEVINTVKFIDPLNESTISDAQFVASGSALVQSAGS